MGLLVNGEWVDRWYEGDEQGRFVRKPTSFHDWVTADGSSGFKAESGRYHLYVAMACPWANRTLFFRTLKGLEDHISVSVVHPLMKEHGWVFGDGHADDLFGFHKLSAVYQRADANITCRVTVPILWDKQTNTIVNNESSEIIRMLNSAFDDLPGVRADVDFYPADLQAEIDAINPRIYDTVNNGVYRAGFATRQGAYDEAVVDLFDTLDWLEEILSRRRYLCGDRVTEADWRLFSTLVRFDPVYHGHFKCNLRRLVDYPNLWGHTRELYQWPGIKETIDIGAIKLHYYGSHETINPTGVVPMGPILDLEAPHLRGGASGR